MGATDDGRSGDPAVLGVPTDAEHAPADERTPADEHADHAEVVRVQAERLAQLEAIIELAPLGIGIVDLEGRTPLTNQTLRRLLGYTAEEFARMPFSEFSHPADNPENMRLFARLTAGEIERFGLEKRFVRKDGTHLWTYLTVSLVRDGSGRPEYAIGMTQDISDRKTLEEQLRAAEAHYRLLVERVPAVVYTAEVGAAGRWHYVSPQIEQLLGFTVEEWTAVEGLWFDRIVDEDRAEALAAEERIDPSENPPHGVTYRLRHRDGHIVWVHDVAVARAGRGGGSVLNGVLLDVTYEKVLEEALAQQAILDPLTGLVNRAHFRERVDQALAASREDGSPVAMLFIDLDGFKTVNDTLGHGSGDDVLAIVAGRLASAAPDECMLARLGGDEFAMLVEGAWTGRLPELADRLLEALVEPVRVRDRAVRVGASIGGTLAGPADTTDTLLHNADQAMYRAKSAGGSRFLRHEE
ncbi:sensor domain-containing diguanylate cyclase [Cellulomonas sp. KRMCY2]|uniref:sensor domain-containing diguanylate cyclase n=1 Tax=Cellulomonas sp. KRMCY2 TaxID=1304865 RepID=UPI00045EB110|nr:sensor domain-containing diguanylate cyclase [Cellulomonas sp. KRMCY2]